VNRSGAAQGAAAAACTDDDSRAEDAAFDGVTPQVWTRVLGPDEPLLGGDYPNCMYEVQTHRDAAGNVVEEVRCYPETTTFLEHLEEHGIGPDDDPNGKRACAEARNASLEMRRMFFDEVERIMARVERLRNAAPPGRSTVARRSRPRAARARRHAGTRLRGSPARRSDGDDPPDAVGDRAAVLDPPEGRA
jgi:hypothetical protein